VHKKRLGVAQRPRGLHMNILIRHELNRNKTWAPCVLSLSKHGFDRLRANGFMN